MAGDREEFMRGLLGNVNLNNKRVLDIGCGTGAVSHLINEIFDNTEITGIDINENMIEMACENRTENMTFKTGDINNLDKSLEKFDAIIARRVLMYVESPEDTINYLSDFLNDNGKFIIEESDISSTLLNNGLKLNMEIQNMIWQCVEKEGGHTNIGSQLYPMFKNNAFTIDYFDSKLNIQTSESGSDLSWVFNVMKERMIENGIIDENYRMDNLEEKLANELEEKNAFLIRDLSFGIIASKNKH